MKGYNICFQMVKNKNHSKKQGNFPKKKGRPCKENSFLADCYKNRFSENTTKKYFIENCVNKLITSYVINGMTTDENFQPIFNLYNSFCYKLNLKANKIKARLMIKIICLLPKFIKYINQKIRQETVAEEKLEEILEITYTGDKKSRTHNGLTLLDEIINYIKAKSDKLYERNKVLQVLSQKENDLFEISQCKVSQIMIEILDEAFCEKIRPKTSRDFKRDTGMKNFVEKKNTTLDDEEGRKKTTAWQDFES
ncbi:hypothetical protein SteCoe_2516 [Stentor coeruleus]|uniref:Uncharacterized protein n=1 Tax=Stentor coeruleus TaxID=5963 RepID=A0A1R2CZ80_9CILI|nr:hypothetical protein SteCoe_2516 [Stentor coeruleus]